MAVMAGLTILASAENLYNAWELFLQGERDRHCNLDLLRHTLSRVGAPTTLQVVQDADQHFRVLKKSHRTDEQVREELLASLDAWIHKVVDG